MFLVQVWGMNDETFPFVSREMDLSKGKIGVRVLRPVEGSQGNMGYGLGHAISRETRALYLLQTLFQGRRDGCSPDKYLPDGFKPGEGNGMGEDRVDLHGYHGRQIEVSVYME